jgi:hypothetical protein
MSSRLEAMREQADQIETNQQKGRRGADPWDLLKYLEDRYMNR